jgi:hypothetical protein
MDFNRKNGIASQAIRKRMLDKSRPIAIRVSSGKLKKQKGSDSECAESISFRYVPPSERKVRPDPPPFLNLVHKLGAILNKKGDWLST